MRIDKERLAAIRARIAAASPRPWVRELDWTLEINSAEERELLGTSQIHYKNVVKLAPQPERLCFNGADDAEFIAAARDDVPDLLAEVDRLHVELDRGKKHAELLAREIRVTNTAKNEADARADAAELERDELKGDVERWRDAHTDIRERLANHVRIGDGSNHDLEAGVRELVAALVKLAKREHAGMHGGCDEHPDHNHNAVYRGCTCGADEHNAKVDALLGGTNRLLENAK